jgi:hypothetical protein
MSSSPKMQKRSLFSRAVAGLVLFALAAACDSPTGPSRNGTEPSQTVDPVAGSNETRLGLTGTYTLTLSASSRCPLELPEAMRTRRYPATIAHVDRRSLLVTVHSPQNYPGIWNDIGRFTGVFGENDDVIFQRFAFEEWFPEEPFSQFVASGQATATISEGGLSGFLDGDMSGSLPNEDGGVFATRSVTCIAPDHGVVFSR